LADHSAKAFLTSAAVSARASAANMTKISDVAAA
jgi:hypothetical protein